MANYVKVSTVGRNGLASAGKRGQDAVDAAIHALEAEIAQVLPDRPDLIVLPEACDRFSDMAMDVRKAYYQCRGNRVRDHLAGMARDNQCHIAYSAAIEMPDGTFRNSTQILNRKGIVAGTYNKNFPVISETTEGGILCGHSAPVIQCDFGKVACAICFDIVFDEVRQGYAGLAPEQRPDILLFSSMMYGGLARLQYWAFSCHAHLVTACTNGRVLKSHIINPEGAVLLSSCSDDFTVKDLIAEFDIETFDSYKARHRTHRDNPANVEPVV